ncbi:hypothetical protein B0H14DRAFT_1011325 [Mycena olivaceomarginata]|nr:hypothetical protein B0H14DRAFT_3879014 [Mycena olivaceomarginata]KAJ7843642.1 hypothetical protein B0H14DRAFT_1011325 [Mycena olivaceomarginata]
MDPAPSVGGTSCTSSTSPFVSLTASSTSTGKKTVRTETERRLALENGKWMLRVTPHEVDCRGCRRTIQLDRRSRYYPGLWEKHRDRCEEVDKLREAEVHARLCMYEEYRHRRWILTARRKHLATRPYPWPS